MDLKTQTDAELISLRDSLNEWCLKHHESKWGHRLWILVVILSVFAFIQGITDIFVSGINLLDIFLIILGTITGFSWYMGEKRTRKNIDFLVEINGEIAIRDYKDNISKESETA
jgi:hypothetical protein